MREIADYRKPHPAWTAVSALLVAAILAPRASRAEQPPGKPTPPAATSPDSQPAANPRDDEAARESIQRKLNGIIIPKLEFRETTAAESLAFSRSEAATSTQLSRTLQSAE
jgi:hypothetical protein